MTGQSEGDPQSLDIRPLDARLRDAVRERLVAAMKARDTVARDVLRDIVAGIDNAGARPELRPDESGPAAQPNIGLGAAEHVRRDLTHAEVDDVLTGLIAQHRAMLQHLQPGESSGVEAEHRAIAEVEDIRGLLAHLAGKV